MSNCDCGFTCDSKWFRYRTGGILIHDDKMLFVNSNVGGHHYMIGGAVRMCETSKDCIEREMLEEAGIRVTAERLAVVCENFFKGIAGKIDGLDCHTLEFYYILSVSDSEFARCKTKTDNGEDLVWIPLSEVPNLLVKPAFVAKRLNEILQCRQILHIIEEIDR